MSHLSASAKVIACNCEHKAQDEIHGKGRRAHNPFKAGAGTNYRCTVCKREKGDKDK